MNQAIEQLKDEQQKKLQHRFSCRAIMVRNISDYCELLKELHQMDGVEFVPSSVLFSGADVMPRYENLTAPQYEGRWLVLTGVSEYLRLFSKNEAETQRFAKLWNHNFPSSNTGRIIIPLWGCEAQWYDKALHLMDDERKEKAYINCVDPTAPEQRLQITVMANSFKIHSATLSANNELVIDGLKEWYEYWAKPSMANTKQILITGRLRSIQQVNGSTTIHVVQDALSFIREKMPGASVLTAESCPDEAQQRLFDDALHGKTLEQAILSNINVSSFAPLDVMSKWNMLDEGQKQLVALWLQLHEDESYLYHCFHTHKGIPSTSGTVLREDESGVYQYLQIGKITKNISDTVLHEVFQYRSNRPDWVKESQDLIEAMKLARDDTYFEALEQIPEYADRVEFLTTSTQRERSYLLNMVGNWMRDDEDSVYKNIKLKEIYPALFAYLGGNGYSDELARYMKLYKVHKLANTLPQDERLYFAGIETDAFDKRYPLLAKAINDQTIVLWIDALGVEWMPLLIWALKQNPKGTIKSVSIGQANLPAETEFNELWKQMDVPHDKLDKLDKLAHKGVVDDPNYYSCVDEQIEFIVSLATKINSYLKDYHRVIITGDHGASRLAARFFHKRDGYPLAKGSVALNHGRYARVISEPSILPDNQCSATDNGGNHYIVFNNYDHFTQSGFATGVDDDHPVYGELHGGATPEEMLVPVIVFDSNETLPLTAKWHQSKVKISALKAKAIIAFNQPVHQLEAKINDNTATCQHSSDWKQWTIVFSKIKAGTYTVNAAADGKLISLEPLEITSAIGNSDGDFDL